MIYQIFLRDTTIIVHIFGIRYLVETSVGSMTLALAVLVDVITSS